VTLTVTRSHLSNVGDYHVKLGTDLSIIALIAGVLGFGVVAGTAASIAKILFVVFLVLSVIGLLMGRRGPAI